MPKGHTNNPAGRPKGTPNKATTASRQAIAMFIEGNTGRLQEWLDRIAKDNPKQAFDCVKDLLEYHLPKLARTEHTGFNGGAIKSESTINAEDKEILDKFLAQKHDNKTSN